MSACQGGALALPAAQRAHLVVEVRNAQPRQDGLGVGFRCPAVAAIHLGAERK